MLGKTIYWLAVLVISLALLVALVLFLESRDESSLESGLRDGPSLAAGRGLTGTEAGAAIRA